MTKSGIGTTSGATQITNGTIVNGLVSSSNTTNTHKNISQAEIPIWVADKKKWVTGISKKTTVNDLIHAILKQCQITILSSSLEQDKLAQYVLVEFETSNVGVGNDPSLFSTINNTNEQLHQLQKQVISSQKVIDGDSKVYKHLNKWLKQSNSNINNQILLKILQRQPIETVNSDNSSNTAIQNQHHIHTSLTSKILKKLGVNHHANSSSSSLLASQTMTAAANLEITHSNLNNNNTNTNLSFRYVDVKLPKIENTTGNTNMSTFSLYNQLASQINDNFQVAQHSIRNSFDPNVQKSFVYTTILERENRLKQQRERFHLIDELIREHERKSLLHPNEFVSSDVVVSTSLPVNNCLITSMCSPSASSTSSISPLTVNPSNIKEHSQQINETKSSPLVIENIIDLNDIYCYFPEMCTHQLNEVRDFSQICAKLLGLDESIQAQRQMLNELECDLQRELNPANQTAPSHTHAQCISPIQTSSTATNETPEMAELRKEVTLSREQTRLQCKQLHDLDAKMRSNDHNLILRERELQHLLEELYIQEIYADNVLERAITSHDQNQTKHFGSHRINQDVQTNEIESVEQLVFVDSDHQKQFCQLSNQQTDAIELKTSNNYDIHANNQEAKFIGDLASNYNHSHHSYHHAPPPSQHQNFHHRYQNTKANSQYLNTHHKSLSYGSLHNSTVQISSESKDLSINTQNTKQKFGVFAKSVQNGSVNYIKTSPSLEFNSNKASNTTYTYISKINSFNPSGAMPNSQDHSGDNDSGISSMSSETTSAIQKPINLKNVTPTNLQILNSNFNTNKGNVSIPIFASSMSFNENDQCQVLSDQQLFNYNQPQQYSQEQIQNQFGNKSNKSVLETLV